MNVYSMTGFGKGEACGANHTITTEIKSVNHRFKDFKFRMSSTFNYLELNLRSQVDHEFRRGSFDISISYKKNEKSKTEFLIDSDKVKSYLKLIKSIVEPEGFSLQINGADFLKADFLQENEEQKSTELEPLILKSFNDAIVALKESRLQEGIKLTNKLSEHLSVYENCLDKVEKIKNMYPEMMREKLSLKLKEKLQDTKIDEGRFLQEIIYYLEKLEIDEEISRAKIHLSKLRGVLKSSGEIGRQIDFLLQELGRETNTIGSKSASPDISSYVVEMKVQLEKIREQALNLE